MSAAAAVQQRRHKLKGEIVRIAGYYQAHPTITRRSTMFTPTATLWGVKTSKLEQIVTEARQTYGPHKQRWPLAALRAFDELTKRQPGF